MAIDGKSYTTIASTDTDADSPVNTTLMTKIADNLEFLKLWFGKTFLGGATADHDHDGSNSKKIPGSTSGTNFTIASIVPNVGAINSMHNICEYLPDAAWVFTREHVAGSTAADDWNALSRLGDDPGYSIHIGSTASAPHDDRKIRLVDGGIWIGSTSTIGEAGAKFNAVTWKRKQGLIAIGTYAGTGAAFSISGLGFQPKFVLVWIGGNDANTAMYAHLRSTSFATNNSRQLSNGYSAVTNGITSLDSDGFTIGNAAGVNTTAKTYNYLAFTTGSSDNESIAHVVHTPEVVGNYPQNITSLAFKPQMVLAVNISAAVASFFSTGISTVGMTFARGQAGGTHTANSSTGDRIRNQMIMEFLSNGVTLGTEFSTSGTMGTAVWDLFFFRSDVVPSSAAL